MKPYYLLGSNGRVCYFLLLSLFLGIAQVEAQVSNGKIIPGKPATSNQTNVRKANGDTLVFHRLSVRFQAEVAKEGELDLDSLIHFGHATIAEAKSIHNKVGLIKIYLWLGEGFLDKVMIDSALYYTELATLKVHIYSNSKENLRARAYMGHAWALMYDKSNYSKAIQYARLAQEFTIYGNDTLQWIEITTKLIQILYEASSMSEAFQNCSELNKVCERRNDTVALVTSYSMFGDICASMYLYEKQRKILNKILKLKEARRDNDFTYKINRALAEGYLITKQFDSVFYYSRLNLPLCSHLKRMPYCYSNIAKAFFEINKLDSARYYYNLILDYHTAHGSYIDTYLYLELGKIEDKSGNAVKALSYFKKAEADISKPNLRTQMEIYKALYEFYDQRQDNKLSLFYLKKYKVWSDRVYNFQFSINVLENESFLLKEQNLVLSKEKEIQALRTETQIQQKKMVFGIMGLVFILAVLGFNRFRVLRDMKYKQTLTNDRLRISRELHDEVGATLSGIAMFSHVATDQLKTGKNNEVQNSLGYMQKSAGEMVTKLSDIVWLLNPEQDTIMELFGRLGEYGKQMTKVRDMQIRIDLPADLASKHIPLEARRNIYLFCKEAINNAVKYSNGRLLVLQVKSEGHQMVFSVTDDGNGFDASILGRGNGLVNMQKRAQDIGAEFHIDTKANQGTRLELQYKIIQ